jgi:D-specific alpha-keto acid dehydrogenase
VSDLGITVYSCAPDEAEVFAELGPHHGIVPTVTSDPPAARPGVGSVPVNRCISVGHKGELGAAALCALHEAGVEHISTRSIGVNHIDLRTAERLGLTVENAAYDPDGVADYTLMLILMAIRDAKEIVGSAGANDFTLPRARGRDLRDLTVGVVGVGRIGSAVVTRLRGFGCRVVTTDDVCLSALLRESDVVTLHVPLHDATHHLIGGRELAAMKPDAVLVNTGRGALVDTDALVRALEDGALGGAALDVIEGEEGLFYFDCSDRAIEHRHLLRLQELPNVIITPHTAYYTRRALLDTIEETLRKCRRFESSRARV